MFPYNSSSHEISTETNAFVQNSKGDVVVLEGSSLSGVGEGKGPEDAGHCDIGFINSSSSSSSSMLMVVPTNHPEATAANDFSTVLSRHSGKLGSAVMGTLALQPLPTVASNMNNNNQRSANWLNANNIQDKNNTKIIMTTTSTTIFSTTNGYNNQYNYNNNIINADYYHCKMSSKKICSTKNSWPLSLCSSRLLLKIINNNSSDLRVDSQITTKLATLILSTDMKTKSKSKKLSDNKNSFSVTRNNLLIGRRWKAKLSSPRALALRLLLLPSRHCISAGGLIICKASYNNINNIAENSLLLLLLPRLFFNKKESSPAYKIDDGLVITNVNDDNEDNNVKIKTTIPKSDGPARALNFKANKLGNNNNNDSRVITYSTVIINGNVINTIIKPNNSMSVILLTLGSGHLIDEDYGSNHQDRQASKKIIFGRKSSTASSSITLTGSKRREPQLLELLLIIKKLMVDESRVFTEPASRRAPCVPLKIDYDNDGSEVEFIKMIVMMTEYGIKCTDATIYTVGAFSIQDNNNNKSNKPLKIIVNDKMIFSFKNNLMSPIIIMLILSHRGSNNTMIMIIKNNNFNDEFNYYFMHKNNFNNNDSFKMNDDNYEMLSKSTLSDKFLNSYKSDVNVNDAFTYCYDENAAANIPALTTCFYNYFNLNYHFRDYEPVMTLNCQSIINDTIVESHDIKNININNVPAYNKVSYDNDNKDANEKKKDDWRSLYMEFIKTRDMNILEKFKKLVKTIKENTKDVAAEYRRRWGIANVLRGLSGGGESSLNNSSTTNWASSQPSTPNNNNANQSGWGSTPGNPGANGGPPNNWQVAGARSVTGQNPNQAQNPGQPTGQSNQGANAPAGPPTSQSNSAQPNQQNVQGWNQQKPNNTGPGQNQQGQNNNSNNVMQQQQPQQQQQPVVSGSNNNQLANSTANSVSSANTPTSNNSSTKQQLEQLNTMREALFSPDGWGCQHVNQDTNWDVPTSPEPNICKDGMWKPPVNNGTDLWEANLRNGGQPPPPQQAKTPWGHTPSTNIGGTWGEDDDAADTSNMWTGTPAPSQPNAGQWPGATGGTQPGNQTGMWQGGSSWGDPRVDPRDPREIRSVDPRELRDPRDHRMALDPREHIRGLDGPMGAGGRGTGGPGVGIGNPGDPRSMTQQGPGSAAGSGEMRGDPRGISGRLNGASAEAMWNQPPVVPPHHQMGQNQPGHQHPGSNGPAGGPGGKMLGAPSSMNQWAGPPPKDMMPVKPTGWEEPSPPSQRRSVPNYDDGTSLWGNTGNQRPMAPGKVSHWKDVSTPNLGMQCPPGMLQNQMPGQTGMKPDAGGPMWPHPSGPTGHNGSWNDGPPDATGAWGDSKSRNRRYPTDMVNPGPTKGLWEEHNKPPMGHGTGNWGDTDMDPNSWGHTQKPTLTKEIIWNSREFRYLCDLGFKKEDVEIALRSRDMNRDEAQEMLSQCRPMDQWRRHESHAGYDPSNQSTGGQSFPRFNHVSQQMSFPPQQAARAPQNPPSTQQLRMLVQQIQLAVQEGYLNHQILNQALAPQTLLLLNQLLQQIKVLQQLHQQHSVQNTIKGNSQAVLQISVQITKTKQQIANLQNQIAVQQATYMKQQQQQQQQQHQNAPTQPSDYYKPSVHDSISALQNSFGELTMNKDPVSQQQSRLNQWKLPSLDKDDLTANEFSRAPGSASVKPPTTPGGLVQSHSSPNMNPLLGPGDGTWSSRLGESGWPDPSNNDSTDGKDWQPTTVGAGNAAFIDVVPEFEPGKPWKGPQMKTIEDDPSITPGSVVRSPLSLAAIKDTDTIFAAGGREVSPPPQTINETSSIPSLSNSTWSFNPPATTPSGFSSSKNTWGDTAPPPTAVTSELWGAPMSKTGRGPPPGLTGKGVGSGSSVSNGWTALGRSSNTWGLGQTNAPNAPGSGWVSGTTWLLLRNLTPQIDGSTLKTLCMQHGPVQDFRLYLNHGIALAKYSSRDEAVKAQGALNNCVLGNTTIFAESPADSEVHTLLQQLSHSSGGATSQNQPPAGAGSAPGGIGANPAVGGWGAPRQKANQPSIGGPPSADTWVGGSSQLWGAAPSANSLWGSTVLDNPDQQRATPSSLNSYLPGDLLAGEPM